MPKAGVARLWASQRLAGRGGGARLAQDRIAHANFFLANERLVGGLLGAGAFALSPPALFTALWAIDGMIAHET